MQSKKIALLLTCIITLSSLSACSFVDNVVDDMKKDYKFTKENNALTDGNKGLDIPFLESKEPENENSTNELETGDTASFTVEEDGTMDVTITEWGTYWDDLKEENIIYFDVEFNNTGSTEIAVGPSLFSVYADDYSAELTYAESDMLQATSVHGGRKAHGRVYADVNADSVSKLEVQLAETVWALKDNKNSDNTESEGEVSGEAMPENTESAGEISSENKSENTEQEKATTSTAVPENTESKNETSDIGIPENLIYDEEDLGNIAGMYWDYTATSNIELSMYSSPEENAVGNVKVYYSGTPTYTGEIEQVATNVYHLGLDGTDIYFGFYTETQGDEKAMKMHMVINGSEEDWYSITQEFVS